MDNEKKYLIQNLLNGWFLRQDPTNTSDTVPHEDTWVDPTQAEPSLFTKDDVSSVIESFEKDNIDTPLNVIDTTAKI